MAASLPTGTRLALGIVIVAHLLGGCAHRATLRPQADAAAGEGERFAFVFNESSAGTSGRLSLYGTHPLGKPVSLLKVGEDKYCRAVTGSHGTFESDVVSFPVTNLASPEGCESAGSYMVAIFAPVRDYANVGSKKLSDEHLVQSLDAAIRISPALESLRYKAQGVVAGDELAPLSGFSLRVYDLNVPGKQAYLVSYEGREGDVTGPRFVVIEGKINALTGWCSFPYLRTFLLNGDFYLESGSGCCGCGITIMELFRVTGNTVTCVHDDDSKSD